MPKLTPADLGMWAGEADYRRAKEAFVEEGRRITREIGRH